MTDKKLPVIAGNFFYMDNIIVLGTIKIYIFRFKLPLLGKNNM